MEENEVELLLETVEKLGGVEADIRKAVLQELMLVTRGAEAEAQPIHILGKAMGQMIRRKPEAVVNRLRQHWLAEG